MSNLYENKKESNAFLDTINQILTIPGSILSSLLDNSFTKTNARVVRKYQKIADQIVAQRETFVAMSDEELSEQTNVLKSKIENNVPENEILIHAFTVAREAARRKLGEEPYLVQIIGGIAIHDGKVAEMKTGEGKTLTGVLPAYLNALYGQGVHIVTVNDYLAKRDALWMKPVFDLLQITTGYITADMSRQSRKAAYQCDITYCTNNEIVFDYLKDNMAHSASEVCHRVDVNGYPVLNFALVDEVDSILIDSKRMPLIISGHADDMSIQTDDDTDSAEVIYNKYVLANEVVQKIKSIHSDANPCYIIKKKEHQVILNEIGFRIVEQALIEKDYLAQGELLYLPKHSDILHKINQALRAHFLYILDREYIITVDQNEGPVCQIIDEHTGRTMPGRRYSHGLHQAIEAKEGIEIRAETSVLASATFHNYFGSYKKLAGMTGTAITEAEEFDTTYNLECVQIPSNKPLVRIDENDKVYLTYDVKKQQIINKVKECYKKGQPVIIGTTSVDSSNEIGDALRYAFQIDTSLRRAYNPSHALHQPDSTPHVQILNAVNHAEEAKIISMAGRLHAITVVTNMAGRGTDIKLGGDKQFMLKTAINDQQKQYIIEDIESNKKAVLEAGGLMIIGVEHNNNRRVDNQLRGRAGRQGDPGITVFYVSTEDEIIKSFNPNMTNMMTMMGADANEVLEHPWLTNAISDSQKRLEAYHFEERQMTQKYANIREEYVKIFYKNRVHVLYDRIHDFVENILSHVDKDKIVQLAELITADNDTSISILKNNQQNLILRISDYIMNSVSVTSENNEDHKTSIMPWMRSKLLHIIDNAIIEFNEEVEHIRDMTSLQLYVQKDPLILYYEQCKNLFAKIQYHMLDKFLKILHDHAQNIHHINESQPPFTQESLNEYIQMLHGFNQLNQYSNQEGIEHDNQQNDTLDQVDVKEDFSQISNEQLLKDFEEYLNRMIQQSQLDKGDNENQRLDDIIQANNSANEEDNANYNDEQVNSHVIEDKELDHVSQSEFINTQDQDKSVEDSTSMIQGKDNSGNHADINHNDANTAQDIQHDVSEKVGQDQNYIDNIHNTDTINVETDASDIQQNDHVEDKQSAERTSMNNNFVLVDDVKLNANINSSSSDNHDKE